MNRYVFAARNIADKLVKAFGSWETSEFYLQTYILSRFEAVEPDVYIVSYPKCGRTWLRVMLQEYLQLIGTSLQPFNDKSLLGSSENLVIKFEHDQGNWVPAPLGIEQLSFNASKYSKKRVVFLLRDPRDVLVSSWYHLRYRERIYPKDLSAFIRDELVGIHKVVAFMNMWIENSHVPDGFFLMTYEALHSDPLSSSRELLEFIGVPVELEFLQKALEESSFEKMKRMESRGTLKEPWMQPGAKELERSMKIRKGKVGGFHDELSDQDIEFLDRVIHEELSSKLPYRQ